MMITKFHRLIQSRLAWLALLGVLVVSMVFYGVATTAGADRGRREASPGTLDGRPVDPEQFWQALTSTRLSLTLTHGIQQIPAEFEPVVRAAAWGRLVQLRKARELGLSAGDEEIIEIIRQTRAFQTQGEFDRAAYDRFIASQRMPHAVIEQHFREEAVLEKLQRVLAPAALVSPYEIEAALGTLRLSMAIDYITLRLDAIPEDLEVTEAEIRQVYTQAPERFRVPDRVAVTALRAPYARFYDDVVLTDADLEAYYEDNQPEFTVYEDREEAELTLEEGPRMRVRPLDEVRDEIRVRLRRERARRLAYEAAQRVEEQLMPVSIVAPLPDPAEVAEETGFERLSPPPFAEGERAEGADDLPSGLARAAFRLDDDPYDRTSRPLLGETHAYVFVLRERIPGRTPPFEEVRERAEEIARRRARFEALRQEASALRERLAAAVADGTPFAEAARAAGHDVRSTGEMDGFSDLADVPYANRLVQAAFAYHRGEVADPVPEGDVILIPYVAARTRGDPTPMDAFYRMQIASQLANQRAGRVGQAFQDSLLEAAGFQEREPR